MHQGATYAKKGDDSGTDVFTPDHYSFDNQKELLDFIRGNALAQIVSYSTEQSSHPHISATPLIHVGNSEELNFIGHIAKRNLQTGSIQAGSNAVALFCGPNAYVSPRWFKVKNTVPTWNYVSVQLRGKFELIDSNEETLDVLKKTISHMEQSDCSDNKRQPWELKQAPDDLVDRLSQMIVAFRFKGESIEGVRRLCQDKDIVDINNIQRNLQADSRYGAKAIADLMRPYCQ